MSPANPNSRSASVRKNTLLPVLLIFCLFAGILFTGTSSVSTDPVPEELREKINNIFEAFDTDDAPGCVVSVYQDGQTIFHNSYGLANLDYGIALSDSSSFYMASISKQVTAAAAGLLVLRGELSPEAPVSDYLDDWPDWAGAVQVSHLFNHTSGLPDMYDLMAIAGISLSNVMTIDDYLEITKNGESLKYTPGEKYSYTNSGYTALAKLVQEISGMEFSEFVKKEILEPLGMNNTLFHDNRHRVIPNRVISYAPGPNGFRQTYLSNFQGVGPGGLYSTTGEWQKWDAFWQNYEEISSEFTELKSLMLVRAIIDQKPLNYAMGLQINEWKGEQVIGHSGTFMGFKNDYRIYPAHGFSFLTLCNREDAEPADKNRDLARLFLEDIFDEFLNPYSGTYHSRELQTDYELTAEDGHLILNRRISPDGPMTEESFDHWQAGSWDFKFQRDENGQITGFLLSTGRAQDVEFQKVE
ncbi:MAG: serine hydrolase [Balneolaceae bacterium]|nr:serine hydrolase [Balneolaceae bacterium]